MNTNTGEEQEQNEKINILLITTHGNYYIRPGDNDTILHNKKIAPINFNMIAAAPLGVCNIVTNVSIKNVVTNILEYGSQMYINSANETDNTDEAIDEVFKRQLNEFLKSRVDKVEHNMYEYTQEGQLPEFQNFGHTFTSRYRELNKVMKGESYENKSFSFDLRERNKNEEKDMTITLFTIDETNVESQDLSILFSRATRQSGTETTLEKLLLACKDMGLDNVIVLDLTCSVVHPEMSKRSERKHDETYKNAAEVGRERKRKEKIEKYEKCSQTKKKKSLDDESQNSVIIRSSSVSHMDSSSTFFSFTVRRLIIRFNLSTIRTNIPTVPKCTKLFP